MLKETFLENLLLAAYEQGSINFYDFALEKMKLDTEDFMQVRSWVQQLVRDKLAVYADAENTSISIANYGKYWMVQGGFLAYLRDEHDLKEKRNLEKEAHQERLLEARLKLTQYRLFGFWIALVVSSLGFALSIFNLFLFLSDKK